MYRSSSFSVCKLPDYTDSCTSLLMQLLQELNRSRSKPYSMIDFYDFGFGSDPAKVKPKLKSFLMKVYRGDNIFLEEEIVPKKIFDCLAWPSIIDADGEVEEYASFLELGRTERVTLSPERVDMIPNISLALKTFLKRLVATILYSPMDNIISPLPVILSKKPKALIRAPRGYLAHCSKRLVESHRLFSPDSQRKRDFCFERYHFPKHTDAELIAFFKDKLNHVSTGVSMETIMFDCFAWPNPHTATRRYKSYSELCRDIFFIAKSDHIRAIVNISNEIAELLVVAAQPRKKPIIIDNFSFIESMQALHAGGPWAVIEKAFSKLTGVSIIETLDQLQRRNFSIFEQNFDMLEAILLPIYNSHTNQTIRYMTTSTIQTIMKSYMEWRQLHNTINSVR